MVEIEFIPARDQMSAADLLKRGICDIYLRTLAVTTGKTEVFALTNPVYRSSVVSHRQGSPQR